ncbi:MAG: cytochrome c3 family protein [Planctomycetota bacterium]
MRFPLLLGILVGAAVTAGALAPRDAPAPEPEAIIEEQPLPRGFAGSDACQSCHPDIHAEWSKSAHKLSIRPFSDEIVAKPFDGEIFTARDIDHRLGPGAWMECEGPGGEMQKFPVTDVIGVRRIQMFLTPMEKGRIQVLPVFIEVPAKRWFDYTDFIFGKPPNFEIPPDSPDSWYTFARNFNSRCVMCHATDFDIGYDADTGEYNTTWKELTTGCESCHGPGEGHIVFHEEQRTGDDPIVNAATLDARTADMTCGACHAEGEHVHLGFRPGDDLFAFVDPAGLENERHLHPDGRARELIHDLAPTWMSKCGPMTCTTCHDPHGRGHTGLLRKDVLDDTLCTSCHQDTPPHTNHAPESAGSRCVNCHMPRMLIEGGHGRVYDHTISIPSPKNTREFGLPNACTDCHLLEEPFWAEESFEKWYPGAEEKNIRRRLAKVIEPGRRGVPDARDGLLELAKHENEFFRAGAVRLLAPYDVDHGVYLADESVLVRRASFDGLKRTDPDKLVPFLDHTNHVLRYRAALALAEKRALRDEELRTKVIAVLEGFSTIRSDQVATHFALGRLYEAAGDRNRAMRAYERYIRINPWDQTVQSRIDALRR